MNMDFLKSEDDNNNEKEKLDKNSEAIKEFGNTGTVNPNERIRVLPIIGQVEGHIVSPAQNKATKYEHIIPQLIEIEQNENVKGVQISTLGKISFKHAYKE